PNGSSCAWAKNVCRVVTTAPTSVTNMTGFFTMCRGSSFLKLSPIAGNIISGSNSDRLRALSFSYSSDGGAIFDSLMVVVMIISQLKPAEVFLRNESRLQRRSATRDQMPSTTPNGQAPWRNPYNEASTQAAANPRTKTGARCSNA